MLDVLGVQEWKARELRLIQVHHEQLVGRGQLYILRRELLVEITDILAMRLKKIVIFSRIISDSFDAKIYNFWLEWRLQFATLDFNPVDPPEERVTSHVVLPVSSASEPLVRVLC